MRSAIQVFSLVGMPGSGKSEATEVAKELNIPILIMGDVIREEMVQRNIKLTRENIGNFAKEIRKREGMDIVARKCMEKIARLKNDVIIIDGLRNFEEVEFFKLKLPNFKIIYVKTSPETRFQRLLLRGRVDDPLTYEDFLQRDERELAFGIQKIIDQADFTIENEKTKEYLKEKIKEIIS